MSRKVAPSTFPCCVRWTKTMLGFGRWSLAKIVLTACKSSQWGKPNTAAKESRTRVKVGNLPITGGV